MNAKGRDSMERMAVLSSSLVSGECVARAISAAMGLSDGFAPVAIVSRPDGAANPTCCKVHGLAPVATVGRPDGAFEEIGDFPGQSSVFWSSHPWL